MQANKEVAPVQGAWMQVVTSWAQTLGCGPLAGRLPVYSRTTRAWAFGDVAGKADLVLQGFTRRVCGQAGAPEVRLARAAQIAVRTKMLRLARIGWRKCKSRGVPRRAGPGRPRRTAQPWPQPAKLSHRRHSSRSLARGQPWR